MGSRKLKLDEIRLDGDTQPRFEIDGLLVHEYSELYAAGVKLPPVDVFFDGTDNWLADGFHRFHGANKVQLEKIACVVHEGTLQDARWFSYAANQTHGQRRSNADKRKAVVAALQHPMGAKMSDSKIAEYVGVSHTFVGEIREELSLTCNGCKSPTREGRDGRTINTANIGRRTRRQKRDDSPGSIENDAVDISTEDNVKAMFSSPVKAPEDFGGQLKLAINDVWRRWPEVQVPFVVEILHCIIKEIER